MNCTVSVKLDQVNLDKNNIDPLSMSEVLEVKVKESINISYTADFTNCYDNGYNTFKKNEGKIPEVWISKNVTCIFKIIPLIRYHVCRRSQCNILGYNALGIRI